MKVYNYILLLYGSIVLILADSCISHERPNSPVASENAAILDSTAQISEYIVSAYEDKSGNLWFGTMSDGAVKFDGKSFTYLTTKDGLINNTVVGIVEDSAGHMWFGTHAGASRYDGKSFTSYGAKQGLHGGACKFLFDRKGTLWAATYDGVFTFNGSGFTEVILPVPDSEKFNPDSYNIRPGAVWCIMMDSKSNIWFGRDTYGACKFDPSAELGTGGATYTHYTISEGLISNHVSRITEDKQGNIWFGCLSSDFPEVTRNGGVCRLSGDSITQYLDQPGMSKNSIYMISCDKSGNVWIAAGGVGIYRYTNDVFTLFNKTDRPDLIPKFYAQSFLEDSKENLWFGFSGGLFRFDGTSFINVTRSGPFN